MEQIFNYIRVPLLLERSKYISKEIKDREDGLDLLADRTQLRRFGVEDALKIINRAEAELGSDCCEWEHVRWHSTCLCKCNEYHIKLDYDTVLGFKVCPYCEKKLRIIEVCNEEDI